MDRYLSSGYELILNNQIYTIISLIGSGATCAVYSAKSDELKYIIKEYCPTYIPFSRDENATVIVDESYRQKYYDGLNTFVAAYQKQKKLRNIKGIVNSTPFTNIICEANNTKYFIVVPYEGATYKEKAGSLSIKNRIRVCLTMAKLACKYHKAGYLLLDIKPDNFFVIDETCELIEYIDFDSIKTKDELRFGNCLSYTKDWAAPEQLIPYDYHNISEKTDIYALGELVFWSVFRRHSLDREHRRFSRYSFEKIDELKNPELQRLFTEFFHITIRPSVINRADSMDVVIDMLNRIIAELDKECYILPSCINANRIFLGRESEIKRINEELSKNHILFLSGIGGIGKSELAKHYTLTTGMNCCYISYEGTLIDSIIKCIKIQNFPRFSDEPEDDYCIRKINMFKNLIADKYLIIIDNMNVRLSDLSDNDQKAWNELIDCHSKILITTRCEDNEFPELQIKEIKDGETLVNIFNQYYEKEYDESENNYVLSIIERIQKHTLLIEMIAKQAKEEAKSPKAMYDSLVEHGIMDLGNSQVTIRKDNKNSDNTVNEYIRILLDVSGLSNEHIGILISLSLLSNGGIEQDDICKYMKPDILPNISNLRKYGWVNKKDNIITVHPIISEFIIKDLLLVTKRDRATELFNIFADDIDPRGNIKKYEARIYDSIANRIIEYNIELPIVISFIDSYLMAFRDNNRISIIERIAEYVLENKEQLNTHKDLYNHIELALDSKINVLINHNKVDEKILNVCVNHYNNAKKVKNAYWLSIWRSNCEIAYYISMNTLKVNRYSLIGFKGLHKKDVQLLEDRYYYYWDNRCYSNNYYYTELDVIPYFTSKMYKKVLLKERRAIQKVYSKHPIANYDILVSLLEAEELGFKNKNEEAINTLKKAVKEYSDYEYTYTKYYLRLHLLLAEQYKKMGDFYKSEDEYKICIKLEKELYEGVQLFNYDVHIGLAHLYCEAYKSLGESYKYSWDDVFSHNVHIASSLLDIQNSKNILWVGDMFYNIGYLYQINGDLDEAIEYYNCALVKYGVYNKYRGYKSQLRFLRVKNKIAEIEYSKGDLNEAVKLMEEVVKISKLVYGNMHDITISNKRRLDDYKGLQ